MGEILQFTGKKKPQIPVPEDNIPDSIQELSNYFTEDLLRFPWEDGYLDDV